MSEKRLQLQPINQDEAFAFVNTYHRHHKAPTGCKFAIAVNDGEKVVGVIIVGRPVSRVIQAKEPLTCEVTRNCTDGTPHVASKLYAAAWRAARAMGYTRMITYTLATEPGTSLIACGFKELYKTTGKSWNVPSRQRVDKHTLGQKTLWELAV